MGIEARLGQEVGAHVWLVHLVSLALLMCAVSGIYVLASRRGAWQTSAGVSARRRLIQWSIWGLVVVAGAGVVFHQMSQALNAHDAMGHFDAALAAMLQSTVSRMTLQTFSIITHLGDPIALWIIAVVVTLVHGINGRLIPAIGSALAIAGNGTSGRLLKNLFERVRPVHEHAISAGESGWSFPSGHSSGSLVAYGVLAYLVLRFAAPRWHLPVLLLIAAITFSVGASRIILQVHFASDVIGGFALGTCWLVSCIAGMEWIRWWQRKAVSSTGPVTI